MTLPENMTIPSRFNGPPHTGNGGYVCGAMAGFVPGSGAEVSLFVPPPLGRSLVLKQDGDTVLLLDKGQKVASVKPFDLKLDAPDCPTMDAAEEASKRYVGHKRHLFPTCFVCGPNREKGDGLRVFAGTLEDGKEIVAAPFYAHPDFDYQNTQLDPRFIWGALDCPGYFAGAKGKVPALLARMRGIVSGSLRQGETGIVIGWPIKIDGRKILVGTALYGSDRKLVGYAEALWLAIDDAKAMAVGGKKN